MQVLSDGQERSRQEYVELLSQIQVQQKQVAAEMNRMALERRDLDESRKRDSEIAPILTTLGGLLLCLLPLLLVWRLLGKNRADDSQEQSLAEMLANEIVAERPILLPSPPNRRRQSAISARGEDGADQNSELTT
jgi:type VI protein secretion system component VasF